MNEFTLTVLSIIFGLVVGWVVAHATVATECRKLNSFYFGSTTFTCTVKEKQNAD